MARRKLLTRKTISALTTLLLFVIIGLGQTYGWFGDAQQPVAPAPPGTYRIDHFVDGDTIAVDMDGRTETVRLIGVDTPETHRPDTPVQCYGPAAAAYTKRTIGTQAVRLEADPTNQNRDRYNRLLRYVYLPDGTLLNEALVKEGYGFAYTSFPFTKKTAFVTAEAEAKRSNRGLWRNCTVTEANGRKQTNAAETP